MARWWSGVTASGSGCRKRGSCFIDVTGTDRHSVGERTWERGCFTVQPPLPLFVLPSDQRSGARKTAPHIFPEHPASHSPQAGNRRAQNGGCSQTPLPLRSTLLDQTRSTEPSTISRAVSWRGGVCKPWQNPRAHWPITQLMRECLPAAPLL